MAPDPTRIWLLANAVKDALVDGFAAAGVDLPARRFVSPGLPAWDCELLAVQAERSFGYAGNLTTEQLDPMLGAAGHTMRAVVFALHLIRCVPVVDQAAETVLVPEVGDEEEAAETILTDAQVMLTALVAAQRAGDLPRCSGLALETWTNVGPQGGLGGGILRVRLGLE